MSAQTLLEQLLKSGLSMIQSGGAPGSALPTVGGQTAPVRPAGAPGQPHGRPGGPSKADGFAWGTFGAGAASGGALAMLLGNKRARGMAGKALKVGSVAAIGALAYKAYGAWQAQQRQQAPTAVPAPPASPRPASLAGPAAWSAAPTATARMADQLVGAELEQHSRAMLVAMVAAAKADGHLDDRERGLVEDELHRLEADGAVRGWIDAELRRPLDPAEVAREATSPELAAEMYLASVLVADDTNRMERLYLDELARELRLPDGLKAQLESQASTAAG